MALTEKTRQVRIVIPTANISADVLTRYRAQGKIITEDDQTVVLQGTLIELESYTQNGGGQILEEMNEQVVCSRTNTSAHYNAKPEKVCES